MNWLLDLFPRRKKQRPPSRRKRLLSVESLEARQMMAGDISFAGGVIDIQGTPSDDRVSAYIDLRGPFDFDDQVVIQHSHDGHTHTQRIDLFNGTVAGPQFPAVKEIKFSGYDGNDRFTNNTFINSSADGGRGDDRLIGGSGIDRFGGKQGDDFLDGRAGDDVLYGDQDNDEILGGSGKDKLYGYYGEDVLRGGPDDDRLYGGYDSDKLFGDEGDDYLSGSYGDDSLFGGPDNDKLYGYRGNDLLEGGDGKDRLQGSYDNDTLRGGSDDDQLYGAKGDDTLFGGDGNDILFGNDGDDELFGGAGDDEMSGGSGEDVMLSRDADYEGQPGRQAEQLDFDIFHDDFDFEKWVIDGTSHLDVDQASAQTCTILSSLSAAAARGFDLQSGIQYQGNGLYRVRLYDAANGDVLWVNDVPFDGTWNTNDAQPTRERDSITGRPTGATVGEYWALLYQRAYLKQFINNWDNPDSSTWNRNGNSSWGRYSHALKSITGYAWAEGVIYNQYFSSDDQPPTDAAAQMRDALHNGAIITARDNGHLIAVLNVWQDANTGQWLVEVYNQRAYDSRDVSDVATNDPNDGVMVLMWESFTKLIDVIAVVEPRT